MAERRGARLRVVLLGGSAALLLAGFALCVSAPEPERQGVAAVDAALRPVATLRVASAPVSARAERTAVLEARRSIELFAETRGPVTRVGAEDLDRVEADQLLVEIDPVLAEVAVERASAAVARTESQLALARSNLERRRSLSEQGVASAAELDDAENAERVAAASLREARAERVRARDDLAKKTIRAPFAGVLRSFPVEVGEFVQDGQQLAELLDLSTARASVGLSDREVVAVKPGQLVSVQVEAYPDRVFEGRILRVGAASDDQTRKFPVEIELPNDSGQLLPGMVVRVAIDLGAPQPRTLIPREAALEEFGLRFVYVIEDRPGGAVARRRPVVLRPVPFRPADLEVVSGLAEGEVVAVSAVRELRDGERVSVNGARPQ